MVSADALFLSIVLICVKNFVIINNIWRISGEFFFAMNNFYGSF